MLQGTSHCLIGESTLELARLGTNGKDLLEPVIGWLPLCFLCEVPIEPDLAVTLKLTKWGT